MLHAFIMRASSVMILNQRCWQSLGGQHGKGVDGLLVFRQRLKVSNVGVSQTLRGNPIQTVQPTN